MAILDIFKEDVYLFGCQTCFKIMSRSCIFISLASGFELHSFICEL
ncbi:MAG: hypothetical protein ACKESC_00380 [Candidatus Hodgkinia cicadicola]